MSNIFCTMNVTWGDTYLNMYCQDDLKHLTAVRSVQHSKFAEENGMASFLMSAKNGDQVQHAFCKIASSIAGES